MLSPVLSRYLSIFICLIIFFTSPLSFNLTHWWFGSIFCLISTFVKLTIYFPSLPFSFTFLRSENDIWYNFNLIEFKDCFVMDILSILKNALYVLDKILFSVAVGWNVIHYICRGHLAYSMVQVHYLTLEFSYGWSVPIKRRY